MITIADHTLSRLVAQTRPHVGNLADAEAVQCIAFELSPFAKTPLDWRKILLPALEREASAQQMAMEPKFFGAWKNLPGPVQMWSTGEGRPTVIVAADFLGAQMPIRMRDGAHDTLRAEMDAWAAAKRDETKPAEPVAA